MAVIKKNQMTQILFPIVDGTDFATIESGITASNFESKMTKKFFGVNHGVSTAYTSGTISKAATLVHSGIFQQTLKATETNYDYLLVAFMPNNTSLAEQIFIFETNTYDDTDRYSYLSDIGSNLLSYLTGMSGMLSDTHSAAILGASHASNAHSLAQDIDSQLLLNASNISDVLSALDSQFVWTSNFLSDMNSDLSSQIGGITASVSASDMSDIASRVWSEKYNVYSALSSSFGSFLTQQTQGASNLLSSISAIASDAHSAAILGASHASDAYSVALLGLSLISDVDSALTLHDANLSAAISDAHSDLSSQIGGITATVSASDMSDIASRVWATTEGTRVDSRILVIQSMVSDVDSQLLLNASAISDIESALDSQYAALPDGSDIASAVWSEKYNVYSAVASTLGSFVTQQIQGASNMLSNLSGLASDAHSAAILGASHASDAHSAALLAQSLISDVDSQLTVTDTALDSQYSDLASKIGAVTASVSASDMSDIASRVWATTEGARVDSRILVIQSLVSDVDSQVLLNASNISDVQSALDSQFAYLSAAISDAHSDLGSKIGNVSVTLTASDISDIASAVTAAGVNLTDSDMSDIASRVWSEKYNVHSAVASSFGSFFTQQVQGASNMLSNLSGLVSDVDSQVLLNASLASDAASAAAQANSRALVIQSLVSDVDSQLLLTASVVSDIDSQLTVTDTAMDSQYSDLASKVGAITASVSASDMSDIASRVWATTEGARVDSRILVIQSMVSDVDSQLTVTDTAMDSQYSDIASKVGNITVDNSGIASAVWSEKYNVYSATASSIGSFVTQQMQGASNMLSGISGAVSDVDSQLLLNASMISDVDSALTVHDAAVSAAISDVESQLDVTHSLLSDVESQLDLTASLVSDIDSQLTVTDTALDSQYAVLLSNISDIESQIDAGVTVTTSGMSDIASQVWAYAEGELTAVPAAAADMADKVNWLFVTARNKIITDSDSGAQFIRNDDDSSNIASAALTDDGSQFIRNEYA